MPNLLEFRGADLRFLPARNTFRQGTSRAATLSAGELVCCQSTTTHNGERFTTTASLRVAFVEVGLLGDLLARYAWRNHLTAERGWAAARVADTLYEALHEFYPTCDHASLFTVIGFAGAELAAALEKHTPAMRETRIGPFTLSGGAHGA